MTNVVSMKISDIDRTKNKVKKHPADQIKRLSAAIEKYGWTVPVIVAEDNVLLAGEARIQAAVLLGMEAVPAIMVPLSGSSALEYMLADNRLSELGIMDEYEIASIIKEIKTNFDNVDLFATGYSRTQVSDLLEKLQIDVDAGLTLETDIDIDHDILNAESSERSEDFVEITPASDIEDDELTESISKTIDENGVRLKESTQKSKEITDVDVNSFDKYIVSISGGKDSTALLLWAVENLDRRKIIALYWDSGWNIPECTQYVYYLCRKYNIELLICGDKTKNRLLENTKKYGYPTYNALWCQHLKTSALDAAQKHIRDNVNENVLSLMGVRRSESIKRSDYPRFSRMNGLTFFSPLVEMTDLELMNFIKERGERIPPIYNYVNRTGCLFCPNASTAMKTLLKKLYPSDLCLINEFLVAGLESPKFRTGFVELVKSFNRYRKIDTWPNEFKDIAFSHDEFKKLDCRQPENMIDMRT